MGQWFQACRWSSVAKTKERQLRNLLSSERLGGLVELGGPLVLGFW